MARNTVAVLASAIVARLRVAMPELRSALAANQKPMWRSRRKPHQASVLASAVAGELSHHFASASSQFPSHLDSHATSETADSIAAEILAQLGLAAGQEDLPMEKIEI
jgi:hypothetical protein